MNKILSALPPKQKLATMLLLSFATSFLIVFFAQFDTYLHNPTDFMVSWRFLLPLLLSITFASAIATFIFLLIVWYRNIRIGIIYLLFTALVATYLRFSLSKLLSQYFFIIIVLVILTLVYIVFDKLFKEKAIDALMLLLWGMVLAMYAQLLFFNGDMVQVTGDQAHYSLLTTWHILNLIIYFAITVAPLAIWIKVKKEEMFYSGIIFTSIMFVCMQTVGLVTTSQSAILPRGYEKDARYFSFEPIMKLSDDENIIVFLIDRFDVTYMEEVLEDYPELYEQLDGFTFYKNNISEYGATFPSVCTMLTGYYYTYGENFNAYWTKAWSGRNALDELKENGYTTNLVLDGLSTYGEYSEVENRADNLCYADKVSLDIIGTIETTYGISLGRLAPYLLKNNFVKTLDPTFAKKYYKTEISSLQEDFGVSAKSDLNFYNYIKNNPLSLTDKKVFNFIHLNASHVDYDKTVRLGGYHIDVDSGTVEPGGNYIETTRACFEILDTYFKQMKENNVYDNTTIILVGDHGAREPAVTTGLLVKTKNAGGDLKIDTESELSNKYFGDSLLDIAGLEYDGVSYYDIINDEVSTSPRYFYETDSWWGALDSTSTLALVNTYEISGNANDFENWKVVQE